MVSTSLYKGPTVLLALAVLASVMAAAMACSASQDEVPPLELRAQKLNKVIMCPVCPGESIDQSQNPLAAQMRAIVDRKLREGWTEEQIKDFFVERYGPSVLLEPPREGFTLTVWLVPPVGVVVAFSLLFMVLRWMRRPRRALSSAEALPEASEEELAPYLGRVVEVLEGELSPRGDEDREPGGNSGSGAPIG